MGKRKKPFLGPEGINSSSFKFGMKVSTLCLLKGFKNDRTFKLSSGNEEALYFNDIIFDVTSDGAIFIAVRHEDSTRSRPISYRKLFDRHGILHTCLHFFSYINQSMMRTKNVRLVTNIRISRSNIMEKSLPPNELDQSDILYCSRQSVYYTLSEITQEILSKNCCDISKDDQRDFLKKFQLLYIPEKAVEEEIRKTLSSIELFDSKYIGMEATLDYINTKIIQWKMGVKLDHLNNCHAAALLSIWKSTNYMESLKGYDITFKNHDSDLGNRLIYLVKSKYYILTLMRVYQGMLSKEKNKEIPYIIIDPNDSIQVQRVMIEAFIVPECRFLIVPIFEIPYANLRLTELLQQISDKEYKKIVFICDSDFSEGVPNARIISSKISLDDLEESCKNRFLNVIIDFQGRGIMLRDLLAPNCDANEIVDEELISMLSRGENIKIEDMYDEKDIVESNYISRVFMRGKMKYSESDIFNLLIAENDEKIILISNGAGMGKTTVLTEMTRLLKSKDCIPHYWIVRLDLNRYSSHFRQTMRNKTESIELEDLLNFSGSTLGNNFRQKIFNIPNKVVLMIDGVDVVRSAYKNIVLKFLVNSSVRVNIRKIIVTTRPHLEYYLEDELKVDSFKLQEFSKWDQIHFLTKFWKTNLNLSQRDELRAKSYAKHLLEKLHRTLGKTALDLVGIPLQTKIIADVFQEDLKQHSFKWQGCKEFLTLQKFDVELEVDINMAKLYEMFVQKKGEIFVVGKGHAIIEEMMMDIFQESIKLHKKIALESLLNSEKCELFCVYRDTNDIESEKYLSAIGIVQRIEDMWIFVHQTFGEYFLSTCLWDELIMKNTDWHFIQFLLRDIFLSAEFLVVRSFLDDIMIEEHIPEGVLEACGSMVGQISWNQNKNIVHLAKEGRLNILRLLLGKCSNPKYLLEIEDICATTALLEATESLLITKYLVQKGATVNRSNSRGQSALHKASEKNEYVEVARFLINKGAEKESKRRDGKTPLHCAAERNSFEVAELLIGAHADVDAKENTFKTPLHVAAENNSFEVATQLIKAGANISARTGRNQTATDLARLCGCPSIVKLLEDNPTQNSNSGH